MKTNPEPMAHFFNSRAAVYDEVHPGHVSGGLATKNLTAAYLPAHTRDILDLGCGTGLELPAIFARFPDARVLGIDLAENMLEVLHKRCEGQNVQTLCMSYFDYVYAPGQFDAVISGMSLHHFTPAQKLELYSRVRQTLRPGGVFLNCDYVIDSPLRERRGLRQLRRHRGGEIMHIDAPLTARHELRLLRQAGFAQAGAVWKQGNTVVILA